MVFGLLFSETDFRRPGWAGRPRPFVTCPTPRGAKDAPVPWAPSAGIAA